MTQATNPSAPQAPCLARRCLRALACLPLCAAAGPPGLDVTELSLEQLAGIEVTSAGKRPQALRDVAAAIHVITAEQLRRSGVQNLPDALRLVPGIQVAAVDNSVWAITARGFNSSMSDKLEVLIDGRSIYTPLFSGVFWGVQDLPLADIERIEVIRGPGTTLWGPNAVNGVINVITLPASATQGRRLEVGSGSEQPGRLALRQGGALGDSGHYRLHVQGYRRRPSGEVAAPPPHDRRQSLRSDFRIDLAPGSGQHALLQGALYQGREQDFNQALLLEPARYVPQVADTRVAGGHLLGRWTRPLRSASEFELLAYLDISRREVPRILDERRETLNLELRHHWQPLAAHDVVWGAGYRYSRDHLVNTPSLTLEPPRRGLQWLHLFVQDTIGLLPRRLDLTLGARLEHNDYTGLELQPSLRLAWRPDPRHSLWLAWSRALRTPNRADRDVTRINQILPGTPTRLLGVVSDPDFEAERLHGLDLGYRLRPDAHWWLELAGFHYRYDRLRGIAPPDPGAARPLGSALLVPLPIDNGLRGRSRGLELSATWQARPGLQLRTGLSLLDLDLQTIPGSAAQPVNGMDPRRHWHLVLDWEPDSTWGLHAALRHVDRLDGPGIPAYTELDLSLSRRLSAGWAVQLSGRNLLDDQHREFLRGSGVERSLFLALRWQS